MIKYERGHPLYVEPIEPPKYAKKLSRKQRKKKKQRQQNWTNNKRANLPNAESITEKVIEAQATSAPGDVARNRDRIAKLEIKGEGKKKQPIKKDPFKSDKTHSTKGKYSVKGQTSSKPGRHVVSRMMNKFKGMSSKSRIGVAVGVGLGISMFTRALSGRDWGNIPQIMTRPYIYNRDDAYLPAKYRKSYDYMKQNMTDFGSRVHLSKTAAKVLVSPPSSTRYAITKTTNSIMRENIALELSKNAIGHTRY